MEWGFSNNFDDTWQYTMDAHIDVDPLRHKLENQLRLSALANVGRKRILSAALDSTARETRCMRKQMVNRHRRL